MERLTTLDKVAERVDKMSAACVDHTVAVEDISFDNLDVMNIAGKKHYLEPIAQGAVSNRLGIPFQYLKRCPEDIQAVNLNHWIEQEKNKDLFIRFNGDSIRAVFTTKYTPVDNFEVLERLDSLGYGPETEVQCYLDAAFFSLSIPDGNRAFEIDGDKFKPGISISNSEVGLASLSIAAFVLRLCCTNGLISKSEVSASYRHVSAKILNEFPQAIEQVSYELGAKQQQFKLSMDSPVDDPQATINSFNNQFGISKLEKEAVDWGWSQEYGETMFYIIQAYTRGAQFNGLPAESSFKLEKTGGNILAMLK